VNKWGPANQRPANGKALDEHKRRRNTHGPHTLLFHEPVKLTRLHSRCGGGQRNGVGAPHVHVGPKSDTRD